MLLDDLSKFLCIEFAQFQQLLLIVVAAFFALEYLDQLALLCLNLLVSLNDLACQQLNLTLFLLLFLIFDLLPCYSGLAFSEGFYLFQKVIYLKI